MRGLPHCADSHVVLEATANEGGVVSGVDGSSALSPRRDGVADELAVLEERVPVAIRGAAQEGGDVCREGAVSDHGLGALQVQAGAPVPAAIAHEEAVEHGTGVRAVGRHDPTRIVALHADLAEVAIEHADVGRGIRGISLFFICTL